MLARDQWHDLARKLDWEWSYASERDAFPEVVSGRPWLAHEAWQGWSEAYRTTYREYVANQREKDAAVRRVCSWKDSPAWTSTTRAGWLALAKNT